MIKGNAIFSYVGNKSGISQAGEKYLSLSVLTKDTAKSKCSFVTTDPEIIDKFYSKKYVDFQDIRLYFSVNRVFNPNTRYSHWEVVVIGVD